MFIEVLPKDLPRHLDALSRSGLLRPFYLAGGTGAALQLGHRLSVDLDFFSSATFDPQRLASDVAGHGRFAGVEISPGTIHGIFEGVRLGFLHYPYPQLDQSIHDLGIDIASPRDIACMKIEAVAGRGSRRDFIDLYLLCQRVNPLFQLLHDFERKYRGIDYNKVHILKSLCYFEEAEREPIPKMLIPLAWEDVKRFFLAESRRIADQWF